MRSIIPNGTEIIIGDSIYYKELNNNNPTTSYKMKVLYDIKYGRIVSVNTMFNGNVVFDYVCEIIGWDFKTQSPCKVKANVKWTDIIVVNHNMFQLLNI